MLRRLFSLIFIVCTTLLEAKAQDSAPVFNQDESGYYEIKSGEVWLNDVRTGKSTVWLDRQKLTPTDKKTPLNVEQIQFDGQFQQALLMVNAERVWRYKTRGDYWVLHIASGKLHQLGKNLPASSLMFPKFSPDGKKVAYVSQRNIYVEDLQSGLVKQVTTASGPKVINGTFDWVYEEEFGLKDGFRWSPDGKYIAYWQLDASKIKDYYMLNTTDDVYSKIIPVEFPKAGYAPSPVKIGVVNLLNSMTKWMQIEGDNAQYYITRMEWTGNQELMIQKLDRLQQESKLMYCNTNDGGVKTFFAEHDDAWIDIDISTQIGWYWVNKKQDFLWLSDKDGWKHIYKISKDGKSMICLTPGDYDVQSIAGVDETSGYVYFHASPNNPTQLYLYRVKLNSVSAKPELVKGQDLEGTHSYILSPSAKVALHQFSSRFYLPSSEWVKLPEASVFQPSKSIQSQKVKQGSDNIRYIQFATADNVLVDAWLNLPDNFDSTKKYPIVFYVYGEPFASTVADAFGNHENFLYAGNMKQDGYIQAAVDHRGSPSLKGASWRKSIYKKLGQVNIRDMAMAAFHIVQLPYVDKERVAVWGWSGGGASTLHLLFRYPDIFKTGIAIAPVTRLDFYDNVYTERYMGLPQDNVEAYKKGSPVTYVHQLQGNLMLIHGTLDDNVHYSHAEFLINELIKHQKPFDFMPFPNRSHSLIEGEGTFEYLMKVYTKFLKQHCPPGAR